MMMAGIPYRKRKPELVAIWFLQITNIISTVGGFQSLNIVTQSPNIEFNSPLLVRSWRHVSQEKKRRSYHSVNLKKSVESVESSDEISSNDSSLAKNEKSLSTNSNETQVALPTNDTSTSPITKTDSSSTSQAGGSASKDRKIQRPTPKGKRLGLMWCNEDSCKDAMRERVMGDHNQIILDGPATGQVAYYWKRDNLEQEANYSLSNSDGKEQEMEYLKSITEPSVLLLVRPNDKDLIQVAADAVSILTNDTNRIQIYVDSSLAGKLKFQHGVDNKRIRLFEPKGTEGFGGNHVSTRDKLMSDFSGDPECADPPFDLICTLGGDGLLMHASMLFQGPVPPVISIAGGSLGFLTQFNRDEMVDAVRIALGLTSEPDGESMGPEDNDSGMNNVFPPNMPSDHYEPPERQRGHNKVPRFSFGVGDRVCLSIRMRLDCRIYNREGVIRARFNVLNEVVIDRGSSPYLANLECFCDDVHLTTVQADGVIFAT